MKNTHTMTLTRKIALAFAIAIATTLLGALVGIAITKAMPKTYAATALMQIEQILIDFDTFTPQHEIQAYHEQCIQVIKEQLEIIHSTPIIEAVVKELKLHETLGQAHGDYEEGVGIARAVQFVQKRLKVTLNLTTELISITVKLDRPKGREAQLAMETVNTIAKVFQEWVKEQGRQEGQRAVDVVKSAYEEQNRKVEALEKVLEGDAGNDAARAELAEAKARRDFMEDMVIQETVKLRLPSASVRIVQLAKVTDAPVPVSPNLGVNMRLGAVAGLVLGCVMAIVFFIRH